MTQTTTLEHLKPGHEYPGESVNSRTAYRDKDIKELAALLHREGLLKPLLVCSHPKGNGLLFVIDGNRRLAAFRSLVDEGHMEPDAEIEVTNLGPIAPADALRKSWVANEMIPLHPADRYAVFAQVAENDGLDAKGIAAKFGMTTRAVEQSLAFGSKLAPDVRQAWRAGEIDMEFAKIFTLAADHDEQVKVLEKMRKKHGGKKRWGKDDDLPWSESYRAEEDLRRAVTGDARRAERLLKFVGREEYENAGGRITKDLFGEDESDIVNDFAKLKKLALAKLEPRAEKLRKEGWSWVETSVADHVNIWDYDDDDTDKTKTGCIVKFEGTKIKVHSGLKKRSSGSSGGDTARQKAEEPAEDHAAMGAVDDAMSDAVGIALTSKRDVALAALLATLGCREQWNTPVGIEITGNCEAEITKEKTWRGAFAAFRKMPIEQLLGLLAQMVGAIVTLGENDKDQEALIEAVGEEDVAKGIADAFDEKKYFKGCSKPRLLECIGDALGPDQKRQNETKSKEQLAKFCIASVAPTGWLPEALRTKHYTAPEPKAAAPAAPKKAKKAA